LLVVRPWLVVLVLGCGRINFDPLGGGGTTGDAIGDTSGDTSGSGTVMDCSGTTCSCPSGAPCNVNCMTACTVMCGAASSVRVCCPNGGCTIECFQPASVALRCPSSCTLACTSGADCTQLCDPPCSANQQSCVPFTSCRNIGCPAPECSYTCPL
jgi:hypothetical protein